MPNKVNLPVPPRTVTENSEQMYSYLYQLVEQLNVIIGMLQDMSHSDDGK